MRADVRQRIVESAWPRPGPPASLDRALADGGRGLRRRLLLAYAAATGVVLLLSTAAVLVHLRPTTTTTVDDGGIAVVSLLVVDPADVTLDVGDNLQLAARAGFSDTRVEDVTGQVTWSSDAADIVSVDDAGMVTALGPGTATVAGTLAGMTAVAVVRVREIGLTAVVVRPADTTLDAGDSVPLSAVGVVADGTERDVGSQVTWASSDEAVATVDEGGRVLAVDAGAAEITADLDGSTGRAVITVSSSVTLLRLDVTVADSTLCSLDGDPQQGLDTKGTYDDGSQQTLTEQVTWTSSAPEVASVDAGGVVTVLGANGQATITATLEGVQAATTYDCRQVD